MSMAWRFKRDEQPNVGSLNKYAKSMYEWYEKNCPSRSDQCDSIPRDVVLKHCQMRPAMGNILGGKRTGEDSRTECLDSMDNAFREYCKGVKNKISGCYKFYPTTPSPSTTTTTVIPSTAKSKLPIIIGCSVGAVLVLLILVILVCCCVRKRGKNLWIFQNFRVLKWNFCSLPFCPGYQILNGKLFRKL